MIKISNININNYFRFLLFLAGFVTTSSYAKNFGVWGTVFPIVEKDIKETIFEKLEEMKNSGQLDLINKKFIANVKKSVLRPTPVANLRTTNQPKTFYYDPTYVLERDIKDETDKVIIRKGTTVNPLDTVSLSSVLFFFDGDDKRQIDWAIKNTKKYDYVKYILVKGNIKDVSNTLNDRIYFDQYGVITKKLGIWCVPCVVKQKGKKLQIQEYSIKDKS